MEYPLLMGSVALGTTKSILSKLVKEKNEKAYKTLFSNIIMFTVSFIVVTAMGFHSLNGYQGVPLLLAILYGVCTVGGQIALMQAVTIGPVSISSLFYSCGFLLPTIFGTIYYKENFHFLQGIGIGLTLLAFLLSIEKEEKGFDFKWLGAAILGLIFSGAVGIIQKLFVKEYPHVALDSFLSASFAFMIVFSVAAFLVLYLKDKKKDGFQQKLAIKKKNIIFLCVLGLVIGLANKLNTYLTGILPSAVSFPVINGGTIFITSIVSMLLFKEKLSLKQKIAIIIGIVAIICIGISKNL